MLEFLQEFDSIEGNSYSIKQKKINADKLYSHNSKYWETGYSLVTKFKVKFDEEFHRRIEISV